MSSPPRTIGILSGAGEGATALLVQRIMRRAHGANPLSDAAAPAPLLVGPPPPTPAHSTLRGGQDPEAAAAMAARLEACGVAALATPCERLHAHADAIRSAAPKTRFLDMIALTAERLATVVDRGGAVGMLAPTDPKSRALYDAALSEFGLRTLWPHEPPRERLPLDPSACGDLRLGALCAVEDVLARGASALCVVGEAARVVADRAAAGAPLVDALDVLADAVWDASFSRD